MRNCINKLRVVVGPTLRKCENKIIKSNLKHIITNKSQF